MTATTETVDFLSQDNASSQEMAPDIRRSGSGTACDVFDPLARRASPTFRGSYAHCGCGAKIFRRPGSNKRVCDDCAMEARNRMKREHRAKRRGGLATGADAVQNA